MRWRTRLSAAAWLVVRDAHAAEDIFQNVAVKAMTREARFEAEGSRPFRYDTRTKTVTVGSYWLLPERLRQRLLRG